MLPTGTQLGHYRLFQLIGSGGMGEVYLAEDTRIPRQVAIKIVRVEAQPYLNSAEVREALRRFKKEMQAIAMLDHRNILHLIDFGEKTSENTPVTYMVMPYRKEGSLSDWLQRFNANAPLSPGDVDALLTQAAEALQHAHNHHIIHQDVKPSNFLIRENPDDPSHPDLLLTDFGVASLTNTTTMSSQSVRGTPAYMSPEQWESKPVPASDQYALGVMAYQLLTGHTPFKGRLEQVMHQHMMVPPQPPGIFNPQISPALDAVLLRALAKNPADRFPSILAFARAFHYEVAPAAPALPQQYSPVLSPLPPPARRRSRRNRALLILPLLCVFVLAAIAIAALASQTNGHRENANATSTANAEKQATTSTSTDPYGSGGTLAFSDPLIRAGNWNNESNSASGGSCRFGSDGYHIAESNPAGFYSCNEQAGFFADFVFEVKMTIRQGDCGGINFREDTLTGEQYVFFLCTDGTYQFVRYSGYSANDETILTSGTDSGIISAQNTIAILAKGSNFTFYMNHARLNRASDNTYAQGYVGLVASPDTRATSVLYSDARLWKL